MRLHNRFLFLFAFGCCAAAAALGGAGLAIGTSNTFCAVFLGSVHVARGKSHNYNDDCQSNIIFHNNLQIYLSTASLFLAFRASSALTLLSALMQRLITITAITTIAINPPRNPAPSVPVVISVPI